MLYMLISGGNGVDWVFKTAKATTMKKNASGTANATGQQEKILHENRTTLQISRHRQ